MRLQGIKHTVTVWKQQCIKCGETGYVIPIWYTRIWQSYLNAVPSKESTEKKPDILTRNLAGLHSMLQEKHRKSVTEMRAPNYSGGENKGDAEAAISIILFCSNTISLVRDTAVGMPWWIWQTALLWELLGLRLSYINLFYLFSSVLSWAFENIWERFLNSRNLQREVLGYILTSVELYTMSTINSMQKVAEMSLY